jgi:hypothetical protein
MKSEIVLQHKVEDGYSIFGIAPVNSNCCAILCCKYPNEIKIEIIGEQRFNFPINDPFFSDIYTNRLFKYKNGFGIISLTEKLLLWDDIHSEPEKVKIKNPYKRDKFNRPHYALNPFFDDSSNALYCLINEMGWAGGDGRYWAKLELKLDSIFQFIRKKISAKWGEKYELNKKNYPQTCLSTVMQNDYSDFPLDWLSIKELMFNKDNVFVHTIGGSTTRTKSGKSFEFSIVSKLSEENQLISNHNIEKGLGKFSCSREYFILHKRSNKKKLVFYKTDTFEIDFEITLSSSQTLPIIAGNFLNVDFYEKNLYVYNSDTLNVCKLID